MKGVEREREIMDWEEVANGKSSFPFLCIKSDGEILFGRRAMRVCVCMPPSALSLIAQFLQFPVPLTNTRSLYTQNKKQKTQDDL